MGLNNIDHIWQWGASKFGSEDDQKEENLNFWEVFGVQRSK